MTLSIITINYNNAAGLRKTIESVTSQTYADFEYIIIDGASTDESVNLITEYTHKIDYWVSEPDSGIYNAMNKGIRMAKGEYLHFLNSGDWLVDEFVVEKMIREVSGFEFRVSSSEFGVKSEELGVGSEEFGVKSSELGVKSEELGVRSSEFGVGSEELGNETIPIDILVGNKITVRPDGKVRYGRNDTAPVTALTFYRGTIEHTSAYIRRALFDVVGMYDESLRIVSDYKWYFEAVMQHYVRVKFVDIYVSYFDNTGISSTNLALDKQERRQVLESLLPAPVLADYDRYHLAIDQHKRLRRYPLIYKFFYVVERVLFKFDKWEMKYWGWKNSNFKI